MITSIWHILLILTHSIRRSTKQMTDLAVLFSDQRSLGIKFLAYSLLSLGYFTQMSIGETGES